MHFDNYRLDGFFDEMFGAEQDGITLPHYQKLKKRLGTLEVEDLEVFMLGSGCRIVQVEHDAE